MEVLQNEEEAYYSAMHPRYFSFIASGVGLSPLYCGHLWPIVPAPDDRWGWLWRNWWNDDWQGKPKYSEKTCSRATLSTTNPTWPDLGSNPGRHGGKPATNRLSYGAASSKILRPKICGYLFGSFTIFCRLLVTVTSEKYGTKWPWPVSEWYAKINLDNM
jgi:hypothetical protein